jgi:hypothetical protein
MLTVIEAKVFADEPFRDVLRVELALSCPHCAAEDTLLIVTDITANGSRLLECDECGMSFCIQSSDSEVGEEFTFGFNVRKEQTIEKAVSIKKCPS